MYSPQEIEDVFQNVLKTLETKTRANWHHALNSDHPKYAYYKEMLEFLKTELKRELDLPKAMPPNKRKEINDTIRITVDRLCERMLKRGDKDYFHKEKVIYNIVKDSLNPTVDYSYINYHKNVGHISTQNTDSVMDSLQHLLITRKQVAGSDAPSHIKKPSIERIEEYLKRLLYFIN